MAYIQIDVIAELEPYLDRFDNIRYRGDKMQCCSPFRDDRKPSFALNTDTGTWVDSGADTDEYRQGNFIKLLALLQNVSYEEALQDIKDRYNVAGLMVEDLELNLRLPAPVYIPVNRVDCVLPEGVEGYIQSQYLSSRGIDLSIQELFGTFQTGNKIGLPVYDVAGLLVNIKYRLTDTKKFWYEVNGGIKDYLYGHKQARESGTDTVFVVEGEIDCLYLWSIGVPAVATFGARITRRQLNQLMRYKHVVIATDNDGAGVMFRNKLIEMLIPTCHVSVLSFPRQYKDVNEIPKHQLKGYCRDKVRAVVPTFM